MKFHQIKNDAIVYTDLWILQAAFPTVTSRLFPVSRKAPLMVSMVFPDFGPNVGKISETTGSCRHKGPCLFSGCVQ